MEEMILIVLKFKMSELTDIAEKKSQEQLADKVVTMEFEFSLCLFVECCLQFRSIQNFCFSCNLYSENSWTMENGL